jgi:glycosyltransferase involved in cell wall biosynthesis
MIHNQDIVVIGIQPWNIEIGSNCKNIAIEMAKNNRVLYVNQPLNRITSLKGKNDPANFDRINVLNGKKDPITKIMDNLWEFNPAMVVEPINKLPVVPIFDFLNKINSKRFAKAVKIAIRKLGFKDYILFNDSSMFLGNYMKELLDPAYYIYYIRDNLINSPNPYWNTHGKRIEEQVIRKADVVVTNSVYYTEYAKAYNPNSYMVGQGCDASLFDYKARVINVPDEMKAIKKPIIGYVGFLTKKRLDLKLLGFLARSKPDWQIVLVGPEDETFLASDLHSVKNIHFLGSKSSDLLPEYIKGFDICINPQVLNNTTIGNYPRKIDEYLAMGKPVVATSTKAMEYFDQYTYLGKSDEDYLNLIQKALDEDSPERAEKRREFALTHSWENNLTEIWKALEISIQNKNRVA